MCVHEKYVNTITAVTTGTGLKTVETVSNQTASTDPSFIVSPHIIKTWIVPSHLF